MPDSLLKGWTEHEKWCKIGKERGFVMFGFLTFGTTLTFVDLTLKKNIEAQDETTFPRELEGSGGRIRLYRNHNDGFSFGLFRGSRAVELIPLCVTSAIAGAWASLMGTRGRILDKLAFTLVLAGGVSNLFDRMMRGYVVDYFSIQWKALKKVVLNLGDVFIFAGSVLLVCKAVFALIKEAVRTSRS